MCPGRQPYGRLMPLGRVERGAQGCKALAHQSLAHHRRTAAMDPTFLSATQLADLVRTRKIGALELIDHYIARIEKHDPRINAVVVRDFDRARTKARALDDQADKSAPLFGVPMTAKESFDIEGLPSTRGHVALKDKAVRKQQQTQFFKNLSVLGGLLIAVVDTGGRESVPHATGRLSRQARKDVAKAADGAHKAAGKAAVDAKKDARKRAAKAQKAVAKAKARASKGLAMAS